MPKCSRNQMSPLVRTNRCLPWRQLDSKQPPFQSARKLTRGDAFQNMSARHIDFGWLVVNALEPNAHVQLSQRKLHPAVRDVPCAITLYMAAKPSCRA